MNQGRSRPYFRWVLWLLPVVFLLVFYFRPLAAIFVKVTDQVFQTGLGGFNLARILRTLAFTFYQATLSTIFTLAIGLPAAYIFAKFRFIGKRVLRVLFTIPFILPTVVVAASFNALLGPRGWLNLGLMQLFNLDSAPIVIMNSLTVIVIAHVFYNVSIIIRLVGGAWSQLDDRKNQAARVLGANAWQSFREVTFPLLKSTILSAALLVFLFDFSSFGVVLLLGGPRNATLEVEIYTQAMFLFNLPMAGILSLIQLAVTLILTIWIAKLSRNTIKSDTRIEIHDGRYPETRLQKVFILVTIAILIILLIFPLASLGARSITKIEADRGERGTVLTGLTTEYYQRLFVNERSSIFYVPPAAAIKNSVFFGLVTMAISLLMGGVAAWVFHQKNWGGRLLEPVLMLPMGTSAVTLGLGFILVFTRPPFDAQSFPLLVPIAHSLIAIPLVVRSLVPALANVPQRLREAASTLGASPLKVIKEVDIPILYKAILVSAIYSFTISLGEFGATSFLSRPETPTIPIAIYRYLSQPGASNYGQAMAMSTILMVVCVIAVFIMEWLDSRGFLGS